MTIYNNIDQSKLPTRVNESLWIKGVAAQLHACVQESQTLRVNNCYLHRRNK